jgi:two-component system sensor histidine kinase/response regulator
VNVLDQQLTAKTESELARAWAHSLGFASKQDLAGLVEGLLEFLRGELVCSSCAIYANQPEGPVCLGSLGETIRPESSGQVITYPMDGFSLVAAGPQLSRSGLGQIRLLEPHIQSALKRLFELSRVKGQVAAEEQARRQRGAHLARLSHQLRTPLSVVSGFCHILLQEPETGPCQRGMIESIRDNGSRLLELVEDVVEMARLEAGLVGIEPESFPLSTLLQDLQTAFLCAPPGVGREVVVHLEGCGRLLMGDSELLSRMLRNVIATTSRLATTGKIHLCPCFGEGGASSGFEILDETAQIKPGQLEALFDPFAHSGPHAAGSSGLQLAIANHYAALMQGQIRAEQRSDGLVWTIELQVPFVSVSPTLPAAPEPKAEVVLEMINVPDSADLMELAGAARLGDVDWVDGLLLELGQQLPQHQGFWERCRELAQGFHFSALAGMLPLSDQLAPPADSRPAILIVDDNPANLHILYRALSGLQCRCLVAQSGDEALRIYRQAQPGVILLDILMPGLDGFETLGRLRDQCQGDLPSVIFLSALSHTSDKVKGLMQGACDYISKPFHAEEVAARVRLQLALRSLQDQLRQRNQELSKSNQQKNELLGMAAHDLRNPLAVITGYASVLKRGLAGALEEKSLGLIESIFTTGREMQVLLEDLLSVSQIESGHLNLNLLPADPRLIFESCVYLQHFQAEAKNIHLHSEVCPNVPACLQLDASKMKQALANLLSNAIKFSHAHTTIQARLLIRDDHLVWEVEDQGPGIPPHELGRLFEPFQRASVRATGGERSTGLGLAIIKRILEGHHGKITVDSQVGRGSTFALHLPLLEPPP